MKRESSRKNMKMKGYSNSSASKRSSGGKSECNSEQKRDDDDSSESGEDAGHMKYRIGEQLGDYIVKIKY